MMLKTNLMPFLKITPNGKLILTRLEGFKMIKNNKID